MTATTHAARRRWMARCLGLAGLFPSLDGTALTARLGSRVEPGTYVVTITTAAGASASTKLTLKR